MLLCRCQDCVYFPAGEYVLHEEAGKNFPYDILGGNFIIKGDGPQLTLAGDENCRMEIRRLLMFLC